MRCKRTVAAVGAGISWGVAGLDIVSPWPPGINGDGVARLAIGAAVVLTAQLMLWCHQRPLHAVFEVGYELGRREAMRDYNGGSISPIRRDPHGLGAFNLAARRINGHAGVPTR